MHSAEAHDYPDHSPIAANSTYRISLTESGVYKIAVSDVAALEGVRVQEVALYGNTGAMLPDANGSGMAHALLNLPVWICDRNGNGRMDGDDYILFYGEGTDRWVERNGMYRYERHAYATVNCYYLVLHRNGRTIDSVGHFATTDTLTTHTVVATHHNDLNNIFQTGQVWVGERFSSTQTSRTFTLTLPTATQEAQVNVRYAFANDGSNDANFNLTMNGNTVSSYVNRSTVYRTFEARFPAHSGTSYSMDCSFSPSSSTATGYLDYIELTAQAPMQYGGRQTMLRTGGEGGTGAVAYRVEQASAGLRAWDVTCIDSVYESPVQPDGASALLYIRDGSARQVVLFEERQAMSPESIERISSPDLAGTTMPDMVIVAPDAFAEQAERLANLHRDMDGLRVMTVTPQAVYDEFSGGKQDPLAFRELLRSYYKRTAGQHPRYLLLMGKGTYDPRNLTGDHGITLVTGEAYNSFGDNGNTYCSDDMAGYIEDGESGRPSESLDVGIGRLPVKSVDEARHLVDKIEGYMNRRDLTEDDPRGDWRNNVVLLADDADPGSVYDTMFAHDAEKLATRIKALHPQYNIIRVFADAFVQQSGSSGSFYPDVNNTLQQKINYGCLLLNYIGHGSTQYIGTERYITQDDIESYSNLERLAFFVTSTCSFGRHDLIDEVCGAERFLLAPGGGIGLVTATRPIVHHEAFNTLLCTNLLNPDYSVGDAWRTAKNTYAVSHSVVLLGDPALRLSIPSHRVVVTHINRQPVDSVQGDTVNVLSEVLVEGLVVDKNGFEDNSFNGPLYATVYDRETENRTLANDNDNTEVRFLQQKNVLYRCRDSVRNGRFQYRFIVPMDVDFEYATGKLSHYAHDGTLDASGAYTRLFMGGFDTTIRLNASRPTVRLFLNDSSFRSGGSCDEQPVLFALLEDSAGINAVGSGLGHDITAVLDGNGNGLITLNDFYTADMDDSRRGTVRYQLSGLSAGWHTLTLKAWNIFNLSGSATIRFYVQSSSNPEVVSFSASPNPASSSTSIRVEHNCPSQLERVSIDIYDMRGRPVRAWRPDVTDSYVAGPVVWDCRDASGRPVPNGIYVAHLRYTINGNEECTYTKIVISR
ncbi:MAG: hypothetical protein AUK63_260 [bacterium P3]|nr:MAG: hypothetical protein AUK63_260 [bacterium P3]